VPILLVFVVHRILQMVFCCGVQTKLIIDWHNYGYTIMQANKVNQLLCKGAEMYEIMLGKFSDKNFTVSKAFKRDLSERFGI
jgi:beta-1,4-mannosyltransferase